MLLSTQCPLTRAPAVRHFHTESSGPVLFQLESARAFGIDDDHICILLAYAGSVVILVEEHRNGSGQQWVGDARADFIGVPIVLMRGRR